jgi:hypothetical protein
MNKYSLTIEEHIEEPKSFNTKSVIHIDGNSITELLGKLPLELHKIHESHINNIKYSSDLRDDDIPF